jgi:murein L,D-transpeptidase YcbB/YkuD
MTGIIIYPEPYFQFYIINYLAMKVSLTLIRKVKGMGIAIIFILLFSGMKTPPVIIRAPFLASTQDSSASYYIKAMVSRGNGYYYPKSVERFYQHNGYKLAWVAPETVKTDAWEGMLLLDCVMQFGLSHADYHPQELLYDKLHYLRGHFDKASSSEKAGYDILLTDALITFMNNLHYGKLNPEYPSGKIDMGSDQNFNVENSLSTALNEKDFMAAVISVQPQSEAYQRLQYQMHLLTGLYTGDCYETPEDSIRKIAVNMERLRWIGNGEKYYIDINIPSYTLKVHQPDTVYQYKVIVGKPDTPTPTLESAISYFTTAPECAERSRLHGKQPVCDL